MWWQTTKPSGRLKPPNILPESSADGEERAPHPDELISFLHRVSSIMARAEDLVREQERGHITFSTLQRVSELPKRVWQELHCFPLSSLTTAQLNAGLTTYESIIVDIHHTSSGDSATNDDVAINRRLEALINDFQNIIEHLRGNTVRQIDSPEQASFFRGAHHIVVSGGSFSSHTMVNTAPVVQDQHSHKILQLQYLQLGVLFS